MRRIVTWSVIGTLTLAACTQAGSPTPSPQARASLDPVAAGQASAPDPSGPALSTRSTRTEPWRLVTLGDSYTEGTGVERRDSWPKQLERAMRRDVRLRLVANLADVNKTSEYVLEDQLPQVASLRPDVVSLLVGANDIIAPGVSLDDYQRNVSAILDALLSDLAPERIFVITTPDYTLATRGGDFGPRAENRRAIAEANAMLVAAAEERGIAVVDISPVSDRVPVDPTLVASDQLHPSAKQYAGWVEIIAPTLERILQGEES